MAKNIRSQYIKNLLADKETLSEQLKEGTKDSLRALLEDTVKDSLRDILNEEDEKKDEEDFEVEEVDTETPEEEIETTEITADEEPEADAESEEPEEEIDTEEVEETEPEEDFESEEMWGELDKYKGDNGEYDLTGMADEEVIKVLKVMKPEDSVRVVKNDDNTLTLTDDDAETEYVIDLEGTLEDEPEEELMNEENLGYTDDYQDKTAMTGSVEGTPDNGFIDADAGVPKDDRKPWAGDKMKGEPYSTKKSEVMESADECNNECNDECSGKLYEIEVDGLDIEDDETIEEGTSIANGSRTTGVIGDTNQSEEAANRHKHKVYPQKVNEDKKMANMLRKANAILNENKELRKIAHDLKQKVNEAVVINSSLAKVINLVTENSTTRDEKIDILQRFNEVKTIEESKSLYETISRELKNTRPTNNGTKLINEQIGQEKAKISETEMYKSEDLNETIDFMKRLNRIK